MNQAQVIKSILEKYFDSSSIDIIDDSYLHVGHANYGSGHYTLQIISDKFIHLSQIQRHKLVFNILENLESKDLKIHALSMKLYTPNEFYTQKL